MDIPDCERYSLFNLARRTATRDSIYTGRPVGLWTWISSREAAQDLTSPSPVLAALAAQAGEP